MRNKRLTSRQSASIDSTGLREESRGQQIASSPAAVRRAIAMPFGKILTENAEGEMWLMKIDGSERAPFATTHSAYSATLCGSSVVFNSLHDGATDLGRVDADGLKPVTLLRGDFGPPTCSNNGQYIILCEHNKTLRNTAGIFRRRRPNRNCQEPGLRNQAASKRLTR